MRRIIRIFLISLAAAVFLLLLQIAWWNFRPNRAEVDPEAGIEVWTAITDGTHNSNTDMIRWRDRFYLAHARSPYHMGTTSSRMLIWSSTDARHWEFLHEFQVADKDVRDPKFAVINDRLILYVLPNTGFEPEPYGTAAATSADGKTWSELIDLSPRGWLLWRPKTRDGRNYYVTAYWHEHGRSALLKSTDGLQWTMVSEIHAGDRNDETDMEFLPDSSILATARLEGTRSFHQGAFDARTLLAVARPPYASWNKTESRLTRLDGPNLFRHGDRIYAVGRFDPESYDRWYGMSSLLGRKRTSLYLVTPEKLTRLTDLPSAGDTSYAGVVLADGYLYISYYTNRIDRDYSWLLGLVRPTDVLIARLPLANLEKLVAKD